MTGAARPSPGILSIDGFTWRQAIPDDALTLETLAARDGNRTLFNLPESEDEFSARVGQPGFRRAMLCFHGRVAVGAAATTMRDQRSLNLQLICFFKQPERAVKPLAAYVRHLFWSAPLHRVYVQLPLVAGATSYVHLLTGAGFQHEGVVRGHGFIHGRPRDVAVIGLLRRDFEAWCQENELRLAL
ncbi:MAG: GNAT family protein [Candidatus Dormiibacterota bacterium]